MTDDHDGVALFSTSHPRSRWSFWRSLWWKLFPPDIHAAALEIVEVDIPEEGWKDGVFYWDSEGKMRTYTPLVTRQPGEEIRRRLNDGDGA